MTDSLVTTRLRDQVMTQSRTPTPDIPRKNDGTPDWGKIEILYGSSLTNVIQTYYSIGLEDAAIRGLKP